MTPYLNKLSKKYNVVLYLFYYEGYSTKEMAELLHIKENNVRVLLNRARNQLRKEIEAEIKAYNASSDASVDDAITLDSFSVSKKVATLSLDFTTTYDLLNYMLNDNRVEKDKFYIGTIDSNDDCNISGNFVEPGKKDKIKAKTIKSMTDSNILIVDEQYKVQVEGNVLYTSDNCKIDDDGIVTTAKSDDGLSYVVYET